MKTLFLTVVMMAAGTVSAARFDGVEHDILDLGGKTLTVEEIHQREWNGLKTVITNGHLKVTKNYWTHGGLTSIGPHSSFTIGPNARLTTGAGDAGIRKFEFGMASKLVFDQVDWTMDHTTVMLPAKAEWTADLTRFAFAGAMKDNFWDLYGRAIFPRGINVRQDDWGCELSVVLREGGELYFGGPIAFDGKKGKLDILLASGSKLGVFWDAKIAPGIVRLAAGAKVTIEVLKGTNFDPSTIDVPKDAKLTIKQVTKLPIKLPERYPLVVSADQHNRCYYISADHLKDQIKSLAFKYPNPDVESEIKTAVEKTTDTIFRKRFPAGKGPWTVQVRIVNNAGEVIKTSVVVKKHDHPKRPPAPNDLVMVGLCGYGDALDLAKDIINEDLCNLYVGWHSAGKTHPEKWPEEFRAKGERAIKDRKLWSMSIYSGDDAKLQEKLTDAYEGRYLGNNVGEYASYLYQNDDCRPKSIPNDRNLLDSKNHLVNRYIHAVPTGWQGRFPYSFSTCGASLSCYELAGGIDFICNEQWAIGAQNLAHTSAEARGAARKWKPEYWCAWNAHEWQTCVIPYHTNQKFDSCYVGYLQEYLFGTSIIVLESGSQGTQADKYTASYPGQPKEDRQKEGYDGEVARRYREVTKKFYDFVKANPRDQGTPETKIAMALGNLDAYLGMNGGFSIWAQHANSATNKLWKYGAPEDTQEMLKSIFFPIATAAVDPYRNSWLGGTPYGQVDVVNVDDETTIADLRRYDLLVFGGWNTMMPLEKDVLERYVKEGGTLVMSRPELTTRIDRDYVGYTDKDLLPLFGLLPPEGEAGAFVEKKVGKGRYFLFTAREFPSASAAGKKAYEELVTKLAREVKQTVTIKGENYGAHDSISYAVYPKKLYFLNTDTTKPHAFTWTMKGKTQKLSLDPCEIKIIDRGN